MIYRLLFIILVVFFTNLPEVNSQANLLNARVPQDVGRLSDDQKKIQQIQLKIGETTARIEKHISRVFHRFIDNKNIEKDDITYLGNTEMAACFIFGVQCNNSIGFIVLRSGHTLAIEALQVFVMSDFVTLFTATTIQHVLVHSTWAT